MGTRLLYWILTGLHLQWGMGGRQSAACGFTLYTSQPCLDGVPLAEKDGGGGDKDERVGAGSEAVLELYVAVHKGQGQPLVSGLASRVHQQAITVH
jgi:hypothetical protein